MVRSLGWLGERVWSAGQAAGRLLGVGCEMHFKLECTVREFILPSEKSYLFVVEGAHLVQVQLRSPSKQEQEAGRKPYHAFCTSRVEFEVSSKNQSVFDRIERNEIIEDGARWAQRYKDGKGKEIFLPSLDKFPQHFRSLVRQVNRELLEAVRVVVDAIRWRTNTLGPHNPISVIGLFWSKDKEFWHPAPLALSVRIEEFPAVCIDEEVRSDINEIIKNGLREPVHHELFREAWRQRNENPRSSLVMGVAALEAAIKTTIGNLIPSASWLVENLPSPPVTRLLQEYVPRLPAINKIEGKVVSPPKHIMASIKQAVTIRNQVAHIGGKAPSPERLDNILQVIRDVMWLLDYYCGYAWAFNHISDETREALRESVESHP